VRGRLNPEKTLFIVSTKSGTTVETISLFKYFYNRGERRSGKRPSGRAFHCRSDPGSPLVETAGGTASGISSSPIPILAAGIRPSLISGLVPAALIGRTSRLSGQGADHGRELRARDCPPSGPNLGAGWAPSSEERRWREEQGDLCHVERDFGIRRLGGAAHRREHGQTGRGIVPVVHEHLGLPGQYRDDRLFIHLCMDGDETCTGRLEKIEKAATPWCV
jgi:hypothetical protein